MTASTPKYRFQAKRSQIKGLEQALPPIVESLRAARVKNTEGKYGLHVSAPGSRIEFEDIKAVLETRFPFRDGIGPFDRGIIVTNAVFEAIQSDSFDGAALCSMIADHQDQFWKAREQPYVFLSHITLDATRRLPRTRRGRHGKIRFHRTCPDRFSFGDLERTLAGLQLRTRPEHLVCCEVAIQARSEWEAADRGFALLDLTRGLWNFSVNRFLGFRVQSPVNTPLNKVRLGPVQTLHFADGRVASRAFWYQQPVVSTRGLGIGRWSEDEWKEAVTFERKVKRQLSLLPYRREFIGVIAQYAHALDGTDDETAFRQCWTLLEKLTASTSEGKADNELLVQRSATMWSDRTTHAIVLEHLRDVRNDATHRYAERSDFRTCLCQVVRYVHLAMMFHLQYAGKFKSWAEFGELLSTAAKSSQRLAFEQGLISEALLMAERRENYPAGPSAEPTG